MIIVFLISGIIIGVFLALKSRDTLADMSFEERLAELMNQGFELEPANSTSDFDNDGLSDEDEKLIGTDWRNPDTDNDGYLDGEELASGYNPLRPAPGDEIKDGRTIKPRPLPKNLTEALGEALTGKISSGGLEPYLLGGELDFLDAGGIDQTVDEGVGSAIAATAREFSLQEIPDSEIIVSSDNSPEAIISFSHKVTEVLNKANAEVQKRNKISQSELAAITEVIEFGQSDDLDIYIETYSKGYQVLKEVPVPSSWKEIHKRHLSILQAHANILTAVKQIGNDPLKATIALQQYQIVLDASLELIQQGTDLISNSQ